MNIKTYNASSGDELGVLTVNAVASGAVAMEGSDNIYHTYRVWGGVNGVLEGATAPTSPSLVHGGIAGADIASKFGAPTLEEIKQQVTTLTKDSSASFTDENEVWELHRGTSIPQPKLMHTVML
ncbi:hypothetical protein ACUTGA_23635 [Escherichia coli]